VAGLVLAGCSGGGGAAEPPGSASARAVQVRYGELALMFHVAATGAERERGDRILAHERAIMDRLVHRCLKDAGFTEPLPPEAQSAGLFDNVHLPNLKRMASTAQFVPGAEAAAADPPSGPGPVGTAAEQKALQAARNRCASTRSAELSSILDPWGLVERQWMSEVDKIQASPAVVAERATFTRCVTQEGVPKAQAQDFNGFAGFLDVTFATAPTRERQVALDVTWTKVFVRCASSAVAVQEKLQLERKKAFVQERYQQIRDLQTRTDTVLARLDAELGLSGG
jgi:hypothetical protein